MPKPWTSEDIMKLARGFQPACILAAAAELDLFTALAEKPLSAEVLAQKLQADLRATTILADALAAISDELPVKSVNSAQVSLHEIFIDSVGRRGGAES